MSSGLRAMIFAVAALLWLSGALWLLAHLAFAAHNEFGTLPNRWEAPLMRLHGLIAAGALILFGWVGASHMLPRWTAPANRRSGLWLLGAMIVLVVSGYALYYATGSLHDGAGAVHEWLGVAAIALALGHWLGIRAR